MSDTLARGDIIQLDPELHTHHDGFWAGQLCIVDEVKAWGVICYTKTQRRSAYYRAPKGTFAFVGRAKWETS